MDAFENAALKRLLTASTLNQYIELMIASQLLSSQKMYGQAIKGLAPSWRIMTQEQAQKIGLKAVFDLGKMAIHCHNRRCPYEGELQCPSCGS